MGLFGAKNRRTRELAHEILKPIGVDLNSLTDVSRQNFEGQMRSVVERNQDDELYRRQDDPKRGTR